MPVKVGNPSKGTFQKEKSVISYVIIVILNPIEYARYGFGGKSMNRIVLMVLRNIFRVPGLYARLCHYAKNTDKYPEEEKWAHIHKIMKFAVASGNIDLKVTGKENLPAEDGFIMYGNHQGMFDVVALAHTCPRPLAAVLKKELANVPQLKQIIACTKSFPMDREDVRQSLTVIQNVTEEVKKGRAYVIFPEGTRSKTGNQMRDFHAGSFRAAIKGKVNVLPVAFIDCYKVLDQKGCDPITVQVHYLKPITPDEYAGMKAADLAELVKSRIAACMEEYI